MITYRYFEVDVSEGEPPPPEQTPGNRVKTCSEDSLSQKSKEKKNRYFDVATSCTHVCSPVKTIFKRKPNTYICIIHV